MICNFYLSVAARKIVCADPSLRYTSMLLGRKQPTNRHHSAGHYVVCPKRHLTHAFLLCDAACDCYADTDIVYERSSAFYDIPVSGCPAPLTSLPPSFACSSGAQRVPYTLLCDYRQDCIDGSDEAFCVHTDCHVSTPLRCGLSQEV